jgi:diguanylate cyclase (GGDEF)-like protein
MQSFDNERKIKIGEIVTTLKLISLMFFMIAVFVEVPKHTISYRLFNFEFSSFEFSTFIGNAMVLLLFVLSIVIVLYYRKRFMSAENDSKKQKLYDAVELVAFILLYTFLMLMSGSYDSRYKIIYLFIMISATIQHVPKQGIIVSAVCCSIILGIDLAYVQAKPNPYFQTDLILVGIFLTITWLIGHYRNIEAQYSDIMSNIAKRDDLTGLYSHGYFQTTLVAMLEKAKEYNKEISLLFIDIDHFKYFNDLYGHQTGDVVLKEIGIIIERHVGSTYFAARYGGEEFTVIMYDTSEADAVAFAENLRKDVESSFINRFDEFSKITVSIGVACYPAKAYSKDELIKYADDALYRAKRFHRNRVETYQSVLEEIKKETEGKDVEVISSIKTLISIINTKDQYTYRHVERVVLFCEILADTLQLDINERNILKYSAYLHDIGKINIPQEVLNKKLRLTDEEWELLKQHPAYGVEIISNVKALAETVPIIMHHHERFDGEGYPDKLAGEEIPYLARILTIADSFDAMTSNRPYSVAKTFEEGIKELLDASGTQFDPKIVQTFIKTVENKKDILS